MNTIQSAKQIVRDFHQQLDTAEPGAIADVLESIASGFFTAAAS